MSSNRSETRIDPQRRKRALRAAAIGPVPVHTIFVAYGSEDRVTASTLVEALRTLGYVVEWDQDIRGGDNFHERIEMLLDSVKAVIVIWSAASCRSEFVLDEARRGKAAGKLITTRSADLPVGRIPLGFGSLRCEPVTDIEHIVQSLAVLGVTARADG